MWYKEYRDYPPDQPLKKERIETGAAIKGCEMHEVNGWGETFHIPPTRPPGFFRRLFTPKRKK